MDPQKDFDFATLKTFSLDSSCRIITSFCTDLVMSTNHIKLSTYILCTNLEIHIRGLVKIYRLLRFNGQKKLTIPKICEYIFEDFARWPRGDFFSRKIFWGLVKLS